MAQTSSLVHDADVDVYRCLGCGAAVEGPGYDVDPEGRLQWLEALQEKHARCGPVKAVQVGKTIFYPLAWPKANDASMGPPARVAP